MTDNKLGPPRLPDPPQPDSPFGYTPDSISRSSYNAETGNEKDFFIQQNRNAIYLQDLVRSLEFYIATQQRSEINDNYRSTNWFLS